MTTNNCEPCTANGGTYDLSRLCCAARFIASLPTREQMANTGSVLVKRHGHDPKALNDAIRAIRKRALYQHVDR